MPPIADFIHRYQGLWERPSLCRIRVYRLTTRMTVVIATELPDNPGTSITNFAEHLATEMRGRFVAAGEGLFWIEHYPVSRSHRAETFDRVLFRWDGHQYDDPEWKPFSRQEVETLIGESLGD